MNSEEISVLAARLDRIEAALQTLLKQHTVKEWYSTSEIAEFLGRAEYTVREWCRCGRIGASKRHYARGAYPEWMISHEELVRVQNEGLLPVPGKC
jgi:hypothetical protein